MHCAAAQGYGAAVNVDQLLDQVATEVGLSDYGDASFRHGLDRLVDAVLNEARPSPLGAMAFEGMLRTNLTNRLRVVDWHAHHREASYQQIRNPIFIIGASRTGTTALSHLLAADSRNRSLLGWEANESLPPPSTETYATDPRFAAALEAPDRMAMLNPKFKALHHDPPDTPIECLVVTGQHFVSLGPSAQFNIPSYDRWLIDCDFGPAYSYHRAVLQLLQSQCPGRWQLKSPQHAIAVRTIHRLYPDARFVITHRDPVKAAASTMSLARTLSGTFTEHDFTEQIASHWPHTLAAMFDNVLDWRDANPQARIHDMSYDQLVRDPVGAVRDMYATFGDEFPLEVEAAVQAFADREPQNKYGVHSYSLAEFGIERGALEELFGRYLARHDVRKENA